MTVHVAGIGRTRYGRDERSIPEMVYEAVTAALADAGVTRDEIDSIVTASIDLFDGKVASSVLITEVVGAVMKEEARVADDGAAAFVHASAMLLSGRKETVLVVAHAKNSEADADALTAWSTDPIHMQSLGLNDLTAAALQADAWLAQGGDPDAMDAVAARRLGVAPAEVASSPVIAEPLREKHRAPLVDGACALVLTCDVRRATCDVGVSGMGLCVEPHYLGDRDLIGCPAAQKAAEQAYRMAGWRPEDVQLVEISAQFAHQEILWTRALRFAEDDGRRSVDGGAINPSGGWFAGNPYVVAGLERIACAAEAIRTGTARRVLAHGCWGPAGQGHAVVLLEGGR
ncbi:MAG: hypothetical protein HYY13_07205 [Nitrospirae bacterium]|nr:hypothetical protein [Nitrospirota bacterium]